MTKKRFTDVWCSEIGHIGITDNGIDKEFTGSKFGDFLNELSDENEQLKKELDQFYLLIGREDWSGLVDLIKEDLE